jgi:hypothetical protein
MTNESLNPNSFLKCFFTDTFLCNGNVMFDQIALGNQIEVSGIANKNDTLFASPLTMIIPTFVKRANFRLFIPEFVSYPSKFAAIYTLNNEGPLGTPTFEPMLFALDGSEIEIYGLDEIAKFRVKDNIFSSSAPQPFYLSMSLFK